MNTISGGNSSTRLPLRLYSFRRGCAALALFALVGLLSPASAHAAISALERQVLINLYNSTDGPNWNENTGWLGAGNECNWYGVVCDSPNLHVQQIRMTGNNLRGSLPSLSALTNLMDVFANENQLTGSIPPLVGLPLLVNFLANDNQLSGEIPSLAGLPNLRAFRLSNNQLSGHIPSLTGLANLEVFEAGTNQLTGSIPLLAGLGKLRNFDLYDNQLTGTIPSLAGLNKLEQFWVQDNLWMSAAINSVGWCPTSPRTASCFQDTQDCARTHSIPHPTKAGMSPPAKRLGTRIAPSFPIRFSTMALMAEFALYARTQPDAASTGVNGFQSLWSCLAFINDWSLMRILLSSLLLSAVALVAHAASPNIYGEAFADGPVVPVSSAIAQFDVHAGEPRLFSGRITQVCQAKGCWMMLEHDGETARVMFGKHAFFLPKDTRGSAVVHGVLERKELTAEQIEHFRRESDNGLAVQPTEYRIVADGVRVDES